MKTITHLRRTERRHAVPAWVDRRFMLVLGAFAALAAGAYSAAPQWWSDQNIHNGKGANDYAAANQGQLKHMAKAARDQLVAKGYFLSTDDNAINNLVNPWGISTVNAQNYATINLGQLKAVAKPFYDELHSRDPAVAYPWTSATTDDLDYGMANIGQLKNVFSFAIPDLLKAVTLSAGRVMPRSVTLTWLDINTVETGYRVERSQGSGSFAALATLGANQTTYTDSGSPGVERNTSYHYRVVTIKGAQEAISNIVDVTTLVDTDDDGLPDAWETAHGLNPNSPNNADASLRLNRDGPTMLQNYQRWAGLAPDGDEDGDHVPNKKDAHPFDDEIGELTITIEYPVTNQDRL